MRTKSARNGFTLVELLVVIAIIGVLVALLLPAVQAAREAARRTQCVNNMKQSVLGCLNYNDTYQTLPCGIQFAAGEEPNSSDNFGPNWCILILPFIEQRPMFDKFDFTVPISAPVNSNLRGTVIKSFQCPTDPNNRVKFAGTSAGEGGNWARGNYACNGLNWTLDININNKWGDHEITGVMGFNRASRLTEIQDGTSQTMMLAEIRAGLVDIDRRGVWAMGTAGSSAMFWHGCEGDAYGPNSAELDSDDVEGCSLFFAAQQQRMIRERMGCWNGCPSYQATSRSLHPGGTVLGLCDGSVQFLLESVTTAGTWGDCDLNSPWDRLITRNGGEPLPTGVFP